MNEIAGYQIIPVKTWVLTFNGSLPDISSFEKAVQFWNAPDADAYLELYKEVGNVWGWTGRLMKSNEELTEILTSEANEVWLFNVENEVAGFFELARSEKETEVVYLGLKPAWIGKGLGQKLIRAAIAKGAPNGEKVWLHTCERDHESALKAYQREGFRIEKELVSMEYYPA